VIALGVQAVVAVSCRMLMVCPFQKEPQFELCLNIIDSELVVVESTADWDTNAVILKVKATVYLYCFPDITAPVFKLDVVYIA